jgi:hypothetical protein
MHRPSNSAKAIERPVSVSNEGSHSKPRAWSAGQKRNLSSRGIATFECSRADNGILGRKGYYMSQVEL